MEIFKSISLELHEFKIKEQCSHNYSIQWDQFRFCSSNPFSGQMKVYVKGYVAIVASCKIGACN